MKYVIFGTGGKGLRTAAKMRRSGEHEIVAFVDNSEQKKGTKIDGIPIFPPNKLYEMEYDRIFIASFSDDITEQLAKMGIDGSIIETIEGTSIITRKQWLIDFATVLKERKTCGGAMWRRRAYSEAISPSI